VDARERVRAVPAFEILEEEPGESAEYDGPDQGHHSNGPPPNQELFRWLDSEKQFNQTLKRVKAAIDEFFEEGEQYE
jgi:hypothetical protein